MRAKKSSRASGVRVRALASYREGDFPAAEKAHTPTAKLPVWHREQDLKLAGQYVSAARKVSEHHKELL